MHLNICNGKHRWYQKKTVVLIFTPIQKNEKDDVKHGSHFILHQVVFFYQGRIPPSALVSILRHFPLLAILNLSQNHIPNSLISELCSALRFHLPKLKVCVFHFPLEES